MLTTQPPTPSTADSCIKISDIETSPTLAKLFGALAKAQSNIKNAPKNSINEDVGKKYADLASSFDACRSALTANGLAIMQFPTTSGRQVHVRTLLAHESGEWVSSKLTLMAQQDNPWAICSAITFARRYGFQSTVGLASEGEDDDGRGAEGQMSPPVPAHPVPASQPSPVPPRDESQSSTSRPQTQDQETPESQKPADPVRLPSNPKGVAADAIGKAKTEKRVNLLMAEVRKRKELAKDISFLEDIAKKRIAELRPADNR
ncbi:MAG: ERF family protein [Candidatus Aenigmarchaeota archaeon]|nr:ERF family protein [Candidatus Aenigmarchaeota archaeon]